MKKLFTSLVIAASVSAFIMPGLVMAQTNTSNSDQPTNTSYGQPTNTSNKSAFVLTNPLGTGTGTICQLIKKVLNVSIQLATPVMLVFIVLAGLRFVWARGNPDKLKEARANLVYTLIGIGIFLGAWALAMVVAGTINQLQQAAGNKNGTINVNQC